MSVPASPSCRLVSLLTALILVQVWTINASESSELTALKGRLDALESKVENLESRLQATQQQLNDTKGKLREVEQRVDKCCKGEGTANDTTSEGSSGGTTTQKHLHCGKIQPAVTGKQQIWVNSQFRNVSCDGEWTVIQRRLNGEVDFYRGWDDYVNGFGDAGGEYWLGERLNYFLSTPPDDLTRDTARGLKAIHNLTSSGGWQLKVELGTWENENASALYKGFKLLSDDKDYMLHVRKFDSGSAGDSLYNTHRRMRFSTHDNDNDKSESDNCAESFHGAWWYKGCLVSNLNGKYYKRSSASSNGVTWKSWKGHNHSLKTTLMKIKPE